MKIEKVKIETMGMICIGALFIGFLFGCAFTNHNYFELVKSIEIEELNIDLNETQMVNTIIDRLGLEEVNITELKEEMSSDNKDYTNL